MDHQLNIGLLCPYIHDITFNVIKHVAVDARTRFRSLIFDAHTIAHNAGNIDMYICNIHTLLYGYVDLYLRYAYCTYTPCGNTAIWTLCIYTSFHDKHRIADFKFAIHSELGIRT